MGRHVIILYLTRSCKNSFTLPQYHYIEVIDMKRSQQVTRGEITKYNQEQKVQEV